MEMNSHVQSELALAASSMLALVAIFRVRQAPHRLWLLGLGIPMITALLGALKFGKVYYLFDKSLLAGTQYPWLLQFAEVSVLHQQFNLFSETVAATAMALAGISCYGSVGILAPLILLGSFGCAYLSVEDLSNPMYKLMNQAFSIGALLIFSLVKLGQGHRSAKWNLLAILFMGGGLAALRALPKDYHSLVHPIDAFHYLYCLGVLCFALAAQSTTGAAHKKKKSA